MEPAPLRKEIKVSSLQAKVSTEGLMSEFAYLAAKRLEEFYWDCIYRASGYAQYPASFIGVGQGMRFGDTPLCVQIALEGPQFKYFDKKTNLNRFRAVRNVIRWFEEAQPIAYAEIMDCAKET